jgi:hypothetical protein
VKASAVRLDREPLRAPEEVDLGRRAVSKRHPDIDLGCRQGRLPAEREERFFQLRIRECLAVEVLEH